MDSLFHYEAACWHHNLSKVWETLELFYLFLSVASIRFCITVGREGRVLKLSASKTGETGRGVWIQGGRAYQLRNQEWRSPPNLGTRPSLFAFSRYLCRLTHWWRTWSWTSLKKKIFLRFPQSSPDRNSSLLQTVCGNTPKETSESWLMDSYPIWYMSEVS